MSVYKKIDNLYIENAKLYFKNFAGNPDAYNATGGVRYFGVVIDPDRVEELRALGWMIKDSKPSDIDGSFISYLKVKVVYGKRPPSILLISGDDRNVLDEDSVGLLDNVKLEQVDLNIRPYIYDFNGNTGVSARLESAAFIMIPDPIMAKYGTILPEG